jgi:hypothetical protein
MPVTTAYLRKVSTKVRSRLGNEDATDDHVASLVFGKSEDDRSVYEATDELMEVDVATAHLLTEGGNKADDRLWLRLLHQEVDEAGLTAQVSPGDTEVHAVDARHRDLLGSTDATERLVGVVREGYRRGEDRIRRVDKKQIVLCAVRFLETAAMTEKAKKACEAVVARGA